MTATVHRFHALTRAPLGRRGEDAWGSGAFGAPRGGRAHRGVDLVVVPGESILAPFAGDLVREARPYDDDDRFSGLLLRGRGRWSGCEVKIFYLQPREPGPVRRGQVIGKAQDIALKYPGITPHVHVELWRSGAVVDPTPWLPQAG
jgi:murein DD-endopeptidase MepM/ murein hydrolase activator NlpD